MYLNKKNNVKVGIKSVLTSNGTLLIIDKPNLLGEDFANDNTKSFKLTLVKFNGTIPIQIEIVKVISKTGANLVIERAVEPCPLNYIALKMSQTSYEFSIGDFAYLNLTAGEINEIGQELENLKSGTLKTDDKNVTKQGNDFNISNKLLKLDSEGKVPVNNLPPMSINVGEQVEETDINKIEYILATIGGNLNRKVNFLNLFKRLNLIPDVVSGDYGAFQLETVTRTYSHGLGVIPRFCDIKMYARTYNHNGPTLDGYWTKNKQGIKQQNEQGNENYIYYFYNHNARGTLSARITNVTSSDFTIEFKNSLGNNSKFNFTCILHP